MNERKFYINLDYVTYCYPCKTSKTTSSLGVLAEYYGQFYTEKEINRIIANLIIKNPYIPHSMDLEFSVMCKEGDMVTYHHILNFKNLDYKTQEAATTTIMFLHPNEVL